MINLVYQLLIVLPFSILAFPVAPEKSDSTEMALPENWERPHNTDIKHISLDLSINWERKQLSGTATLTLSLFNPSDRIFLDAGMLTINSVSLADGTKLKFNYDGSGRNDALEIFLGKQFKPGKDLTLVIDYHTNHFSPSDPNSLGGSNGKGLRFFSPTSTEPTRNLQLWTMGEPESNRFWFPGYDSPNDLRTTEIKITTAKNLTAVSNGILIGKKENKNGTVTFHYKSSLPYPNSQTSLVAGSFVDIKQSVNGVEVHNFSHPNEVEATKASVVRLPEMIRYFSDVTGVPFPYPSYSQIFVYDIPWGFGTQSLAIQSENMVDDFGTHADYLYLWDMLEGETLAQQWFGNYLSVSGWKDVWLNKAFIRYFSELFCEYKNGRDEFLLYQHVYDHNFVYMNDWNSGVRQPVATNRYDDMPSFVGSNTPYFHGAEVLHMLRKHLGDDIWWKSIKLYVKPNANRNVVTEDFRKAVEEASGEPMDWFFDQWVYKIGHPVFEVSKSYSAEKKMLTLTVRQTQKPDSTSQYGQVKFFRGKIDITIDGKTLQVWLKPEFENKFLFESSVLPKLVNFDVESTWIKELTFEKSTAELLYQFQNDQDIMGRSWAMGELVRLMKAGKIPDAEKESVYRGFRQVISGTSYWRLRANALTQLQSLIAPNSEAKPVSLDKPTLDMLLELSSKEKSWVKTNAIRFLGMTRNPDYADLYISAFQDVSDRVVNAAAISLGQSKSPKAFEALIKLAVKPSWKNQSLISSLYGLKELNDPRGFELAFSALKDLTSPHWVLATPVWDYRLSATETIRSLGKSSLAYSFLFDSFKKALDENDIHGIFYSVTLLISLAEPRGEEMFVMLKEKFKQDETILGSVLSYETQFREATGK